MQIGITKEVKPQTSSRIPYRSSQVVQGTQTISSGLPVTNRILKSNVVDFCFPQKFQPAKVQELVVNENVVDPIKRGLGLLPYGSFKQPKHKKAPSSQRPSNKSSA